MKSITARKYVIAGSLSVSLSPAMFAQTHKAAQPSDWDIEGQVQQATANDHIFIGSSIMSSVKGGVVKLTGNVRSETEKEYASSDLANIPGVKTVLNNLEVVHRDVAPPPPAKVAGPTGPRTLTLAAGTVIPVRLTEEIDTKTVQAGTTFHATTASNVGYGGYTLIPAGTPVTGRVVEAKAAGRLSGSAPVGRGAGQHSPTRRCGGSAGHLPCHPRAFQQSPGSRDQPR